MELQRQRISGPTMELRKKLVDLGAEELVNLLVGEHTVRVEEEKVKRDQERQRSQREFLQDSNLVETAKVEIKSTITMIRAANCRKTANARCPYPLQLAVYKVNRNPYDLNMDQAYLHQDSAGHTLWNQLSKEAIEKEQPLPYPAIMESESIYFVDEELYFKCVEEIIPDNLEETPEARGPRVQPRRGCKTPARVVVFEEDQ